MSSVLFAWIASITYGGLLGTFMLGLFFKRIEQPAAIAGFTSGIFIMLLIILIPKLSGTNPWVHWTWFVAIGSTVCILVGNLWQKIIIKDRSAKY